MDASHNESGATCWVPGCNQVVTEELLRVSHRVQTCAHHRLAPAVLVKGTLKRFCQQCTRFHELAKFDGQKRSCRMRLGKLNKRRRDNKAKEMFGYGYPPGRDESPQKTTRTSGSDEQDFDQTRDDTRTTSPDYHSSELHKTDWTPTSTNQPTRRASVPMARTEHTIHVPSAVRPSSYNVYQTLVELQRQRQLGQGQYQMGLNHWGGSGTGDPAPTNMTQGISSQSKVPGKEFAMTTTSWNAQPASKVKSISADRASFPHTAALTHAAQNAWAAELLKKASCITARGSLSQVHTTNHSAPASWDPQSVKNMNNMLSSSGNIPQTRPLSSHSAAAVGCKSRGRAVDDLHGAQEIFPPAKYATLSETEMPFTMVMELRVRMAREKRNKQHAQVQAAEARNEV